MADQDRRGHEDHAWAELTWMKLFSFVIKFGFVPGMFVGGMLVAIGAFTNWYWLLLVALGQTFITHLWLGPAILIILGLAIYASHLSKKGGGRKRQPETKEQPAKS